MDMQTLVFPAILMGIMLIFLAVFLVVNKSQHKKASINTDNKKADINKANNSGKNSKSNTTSADNIKKEDVFSFMEFDRILDNMVVQNDGTKFTMAIKCKGINYDLMSDMEQISVEEGFITFLNTLRYPIQLYVQAQNIDLKAAINTYKQNAGYIADEYETANKVYTDLLDQFDAKQEDIEVAQEKRERVLNLYEYASDIINYVEKLSLNKSLLQRNFYVLVSYYSSEITSASSFSKEEIVNICYNELLTRAQSIISGLSACSVTGTILSSNELADLLYTAYNRDDKGLLSVREAIQSGFYRLYSTSEDVFYKKQQKQIERINEEAELKAYEAIQMAIKEGKYISKSAEALDEVEQVSKTAAEIVKKEPIPQEIKEKAKEILVEDYVVNKNRIMTQAALEEQQRRIERTSSSEPTDFRLQNNDRDNSDIENQTNNNSSSKVEDGNSSTTLRNSNSDVDEQLDNRMGYDLEQTESKKDDVSSENNVNVEDDNGDKKDTKDTKETEDTNNNNDDDDLII